MATRRSSTTSTRGVDRSSPTEYGWAGRGVEVSGGGVLDDLAGVHHGDPVAHAGDDAEVVGDQQHGDVEALLQIGEEIEDLRLDRHVEGGRRLVGDEQLAVRMPGPWR